MKLKYDFDCEKCKSKDICKYYAETSKYCKKELDVKLKPKEESSKENLVIKVNCKYYKTEETVLNYPYNVRGLDDITVINNPFEPHFDPNSTGGSYPANTNITVSNNIESVPKAYACSEHLGVESSKNVSKIITSKKHI